MWFALPVKNYLLIWCYYRKNIFFSLKKTYFWKPNVWLLLDRERKKKLGRGRLLFLVCNEPKQQPKKGLSSLFFVIELKRNQNKNRDKSISSSVFSEQIYEDKSFFYLCSLSKPRTKRRYSSSLYLFSMIFNLIGNNTKTKFFVCIKYRTKAKQTKF